MKNFRNTYLLTALAAVTALMIGAAVAQAAKTNKGAVQGGVDWIRSSGLSQFPSSGGTGFKSDTVSALKAAKKIGVSVPDSTVDRFIESVSADATNYAGSAGATSKLILAATAAGRNPRCFGPDGEKSDLIAILESDYNSSSGQYGKTSFDQGLALLARKAAHEKTRSKAVSFAKSRRGQYGWNFAMSKSSGDDVESSALLIEALRAAGVSKKDNALKSAYKWITYQRNQDGGYNPDAPNGETQADATAYAIRAFDTMGASTKKAKRALRALQKKGGSFRSSPSAGGTYPTISTTNAVIALSGAHYPVVARSKAGKSCV